VDSEETDSTYDQVSICAVHRREGEVWREIAGDFSRRDCGIGHQGPQY
jgi:hypothetical protein